MSLRILHVSPAYYPAHYWGGPIHSVHGLCNALARLPETSIRVLTTDSAGPRFRQRLEPSAWPVRYGDSYEVYFCSKWFGTAIAPGMIRHIFDMVRWADVVHLTAVYSFPTIPVLIACRVIGKPLVWWPHGAYIHWEHAPRRSLKWLWDKICVALLQADKTILHVASDREAADTRSRMPRVRIARIPNGVDVAEQLVPRAWKPGGTLRLMYLGRLHPIKGIENLLRAVQRLSNQSITLTINGTGEIDYVAELRAHTKSLGLESRVQFVGPVEGAKKTSAFLNADICIVPSFSESFGMVVAESLANGVPVVASTGTPWESLERKGCGLWVANDPESLAAAIVQMRGMQLPEMGARGHAWMKTEFRWDTTAAQMHALYQDICGDERTDGKQTANYL